MVRHPQRFRQRRYPRQGRRHNTPGRRRFRPVGSHQQCAEVKNLGPSVCRLAPKPMMDGDSISFDISLNYGCACHGKVNLFSFFTTDDLIHSR